MKVEDAVRDIDGNVTYANGTSTGTYTLTDGSGNTFTETIPVTVSDEVHIVGNRTTVELEADNSVTQNENNYVWNNVSDDNYTKNNYSLSLIEGRVLDPSIETIPITIKVPNATESNGVVTYSDNISILGLPEGDTFGNTLNLSEISRNGNITSITVNNGEGYILTPNADGTYTALVANGIDPTTGVYLYTSYVINIEPGSLSSIVPTPSPVSSDTPTVNTPEIKVPEVVVVPTETEIKTPETSDTPVEIEIKTPEVSNTPVETDTNLTEKEIEVVENIPNDIIAKNTDDVDDVKIMTHVQTGWYADVERKTTILENNDDQNRASGTTQSESDNVVINIDAQEDIPKTIDNVVSLEEAETSNYDNPEKKDADDEEVEKDESSDSSDEKSASESNQTTE